MSLEQIVSTDLSTQTAKRGGRVMAFGAVPAHRRYELRQARYLDMVPTARAALAGIAEPAILDIGCGEGTAKRFFDFAGIAGYWTGIEIDARRVPLCRQLGYHRILDDHDLEHTPLPFADESFDLVVASHIIEHLVDDQAALRDWMRVLRPGGRLILGVPMHLRPIAALARARYRLRGRQPYGHCQFYTMHALRRLLSACQVDAIRGFRLLSARKWLPLEDCEWFYRASVAFGRRFPALTQEVNVEIRKLGADGS